MLSGRFLGNPIESWLIATVITIALFVLLKGIQWLVAHRLAKLAATTVTRADDLIIDVLRKTRLFFLFAVSVYAGSSWLTLQPQTHEWIGRIVMLVFLVQAGIWAGRAITFVLDRAIKEKAEEDAATATSFSALGFISRLLLWSILLLVALDNLGVDVTALVTGLGIGGVAVALALQNVLGDLFASLSIVLDKPFVIGDFIVVGEQVGTVERVGLKTTRIKSLSGEQLIFSNSDLLASRIRNFKRMQERRILFSVGVTYQTSHGQLARISQMLRDIVDAQPNARFDRAHFKGFGDSSLDFEIVYFVLSPEYPVYMDTQQAINLEIYRRFGEEGIEFAYPTRTLHLYSENGNGREPAIPDKRKEDAG